MALSKDASYKGIAHCLDGDVPTLCEVLIAVAQGIVEDAAVRIHAPLAELFDDAIEASLTCADRARNVIDEVGVVDFEVQFAYPRFSSVSKPCPKMYKRTDVLEENIWLIDLIFITALNAFSPVESTGVVVGGLSLPDQILHGSIGSLFLVGAGMIVKRHIDRCEIARIPTYRCVAILSMSAAQQFMFLHDGVLDFLLHQCEIPAVALHHVPELILNPLLVANVAFLSGLTSLNASSSMVASSVLAYVSVSSSLAATPLQACVCLGSSVLLIVVISGGFAIFHTFSRLFLPENQLRVRWTGQTMIFVWTMELLAQAAGVAGALSGDEQVQFLSFSGLLSKLGVCQLFTNSRMALDAATEFLAQAGEDSSEEEPYIEPQPAQ